MSVYVCVYIRIPPLGIGQYLVVEIAAHVEALQRFWEQSNHESVFFAHPLWYMSLMDYKSIERSLKFYF